MAGAGRRPPPRRPSVGPADDLPGGSTAVGADVPGLRVPAGSVIDWIMIDRLARQLSTAPPDVVGVAAPTGPLPPGASYRTHAERLALLPLTAVERVARAPAGAAVLVRDDDQDRLRTDRPGPVLVDRGTHCHDPRATPAEILPAGPAARSPFPVRPVVLFVQGAAGPVDERVHALVDAALAVDVEARMALPALPPGSHMTRPCAPVHASSAALDPDIVVPLDDAGRRSLDEWSALGGPPPIRIELDDDVAGFEVLSWRRGATTAPVRARVGPDVALEAFAQLVNRLSSGPRPLRPLDVEPA